MKILSTIFLMFILVSETEASWNISKDGFLLNSVKYTNIKNTDYFSIVFITKNHNGILVYTLGEDNYLLLELYHAVIRFSVKFIGQNTQEPYIGYIGSGLADGQPHQIEIYRETFSTMLVLDRGKDTALASWPVFSSEELLFKINRVYVGGFNAASKLDRFISVSKESFVGCIAEATWNNVNLLFFPYPNNSVSYCILPEFNPISFVSPNSFITLNRDNYASGLTLVFDVITYLNYSTILYHEDGESKLNISVSNGSLAMLLDFGDVNYINAYLPMIKINDGSWHRIVVQLPGRLNILQRPIVVFGVDDEIVTSYSSFNYDTCRDITFGGHGFMGCIENLIVDGRPFEFLSSTNQSDVVENGCLFPDQCVPNPCQHGGFCSLREETFSCQCSASYPGYVCDDANYYLSCAAMYDCGFKDPGEQMIDVDGIGPFSPAPVLCNNMESPNKINVITEVNNLLPLGTMVIKNEPTTVAVPYPLTLEELRLLTLNSRSCTQQVTYECSSSRITDGNTTLLVWTGGDGIVHDYWNSQQIYATCECFLKNQKCDLNNRCNCDVNDRITRFDSVVFDRKDHLPIIGITAMDISSSTGKWASIKIGPLRCTGVGGKYNAVTFQETFSYLSLPAINFAGPGTIQFEFKTDFAQGNVMVLVQGRPQTEYLVIELTSSSEVTAFFSDGNKCYILSVVLPVTSNPLNDLQYHTVFFKINNLVAYLIIDGVMRSINIIYHFVYPITVNKDHTPLYLGGSPYNMFSGYRGTIRRLYVNGKIINLPYVATISNLIPAGVHPGRYSACVSSPNPCNYGTCVDHFNYYLCDCSSSPYYGKNCENEIGMRFEQSSSAVAYFFTKKGKVTSMIITVSFVTSKDGLLFLLQGIDINVFISIDVYQNNLRLAINFGQHKKTNAYTYIITNSVLPFKFTDGRVYVVKFELETYQYTVTVNGKENVIEVPLGSSKQQLQFDTPRWAYVGYTTPLTDFPQLKFSQFIGCMGGMKVKFVYEGITEPETIDIFKSIGGINSKLIGNGVSAGTCVGNLTVAPPAKLLATPPNMVPGGGLGPISSANSDSVEVSVGLSWTPVIVGIVLLLAFMLIIGSLLFLRWYSRNHGVYMTQEADQFNRKIDNVQSKKREKPSVALPQMTVNEIEGWYL